MPPMSSRPRFPALPPALSSERVEIDSIAGGLSFYVAGTAEGASAHAYRTPLLLLHSINASASAYEARPLYEHYRQRRPVYTPDLSGFGVSERNDRPYLPRLMTDAVHAMVSDISRDYQSLTVPVWMVHGRRAASSTTGTNPLTPGYRTGPST